MEVSLIGTFLLDYHHSLSKETMKEQIWRLEHGEAPTLGENDVKKGYQLK